MSRPKRRRLMLGACVVGLLAAVLWAAGIMESSREEAQAAMQNLTACTELAAKIEALREQPVAPGQTTPTGVGIMDLARQIDAAKSAAGLSDANIVRIDPQEARRIGDGPYKEQLTLLLLRQVTLQQCVTFLHALSDGRPGLGVREIRLSAPQDSERGTWTAELTLGNLVYSPLAAENTAKAD